MTVRPLEDPPRPQDVVQRIMALFDDYAEAFHRYEDWPGNSPVADARKAAHTALLEHLVDLNATTLRAESEREAARRLAEQARDAIWTARHHADSHMESLARYRLNNKLPWESPTDRDPEPK